MNKGKRTYFLIGLAVLVWLGVAYRILHYLAPYKAIDKESKKVVQKDVFFLRKTERRLLDTSQMHYRDPFEIKEKKGTKQRRSIVEREPLLSVEESLPISILYLGFIKGKRGSLFSISIDSKQHLMKKGEQIEGVELLYGDSQRIKIRYQSRKMTIER